MRLAAVILAAGLSTRMGRPKPLLPLGRGTVLGLAVAACRGAGADPALVVSGREREAVEALARDLGARPVHNPDFAAGMFSSLRAGVAALPPDAEAFLVLPADIPLVRPATLRLLAEAAAASPALAVHPCFRGVRGHPPLLRAALIPAILAHDGSGGLRGLLERMEREQPGAALEVDLADAGALRDLDTPADYAAARERAARMDIPEPEEIAALWDLADAPDPTREHCRAVARAARLLAGALPGLGPGQAELAEAGGLLHDLAKGQPRHEAAAQAFLERHGFPALGAAVGAHRDLDLASDAALGARELVFLADKFVRGTTRLPLARRYQEKLEQWAHQPTAHAEIAGRLERARRVLARYEALAGRAAWPLLQGDAQWPWPGEGRP